MSPDLLRRAGVRRGKPLLALSGEFCRRRQARIEALEKRQMMSASISDAEYWTDIPCNCRTCAGMASGAMAILVGGPTDGDGGGDPQGSGGPPVPISQVPVLSSNPSASVKLYIDFNGDVAQQWGSSSVPATPAFSTDSDLTTFSSTELAAINEIWMRVSEKYSPFNIDVTTIDPGSYVDRQSFKVVVGGNGAWANGIGSGVAYTGSFWNFRPNVAWVFEDLLSSNSKMVGEVVAHEAGHGFGLNHQSTYSGSTVTNAYNPGNGVIAPVMGNSLSSTRGLWWNGTSSAGPTTIQDDLSVLSGSNNGFGYRPDDHGSVLGAATTLTLSGTTYSASGVIEQTTDADFFRFDVPSSGSVSINGSIAQFGGMLDMSLELYNASGTLLTSAATTSLAESISTSLSAGTYFVAVKSAGNYGDIGQFSLAITVPASGGQAAPVAIAGGPYSMAEGSSVVLSGASSTGTGLSYAWDLDGDGVFGETGAGATRGSESGVSVTLGGSGLDGPSTYNVQLRVTDSIGQTSTVTVPVSITDVAPVVALSGATSGSEGTAITIGFTATDAGGASDPTTSWVVTWGDGTTSTYVGSTSSATKTYLDNGTYTVRVTAVNKDGSAVSTRSVAIANVAPTLTASVGATRLEGTPLTLNFSSTDPGADTVSQWVVEWGDGTTSTYAGTATSASKTYADNGSYTIRITATDEDGSYQTTASAIVADVAPTLSVVGSSGSVEGSVFTLTWSATDPGTDTVSQWVVEWGDGTTSTYAGSVLSASRTYADNGTYAIRLTATNEDGTYQTTTSASVGNVAPTLSVTAGSSAQEGSPFTLNFAATDPGTDTVSQWVVEWGDGTTTTYAGSVTAATKTYADDGNYTVRVTATDEDGSYQATLPVAVANVVPQLTVSAPSTVVAGAEYRVDFFATDPGADTISGWSIDWGDGTTAFYAGTATSATKIYSAAGAYTVQVRATDEDGTYTHQQSLTVSAAPVAVSVSGSAFPVEGSVFTLSFSASSAVPTTVSSWTVTWGDGTTSTFTGAVGSATRTYADNGFYTARVTAVVDGQSYLGEYSVSVANVAPTLTVSASATRQEGTPLTLTWSASDPGADTVSAWMIEWGDGTTSTFAGGVTSASKAYADNGTYTVRITATDEDGNYLTTLPLTISNVAPTISVSASATRQEGSPLTLSWSASDPGADTVSAWKVEWGDGTTSTYAGSITSATKTYADDGSYTVRLTATDEDGNHQATLPLTISNVAPTVSVSASATRQEGTPVTLNWSAADPGADTVSTWRVEWGDGTTSTFAGSVLTGQKTYADNGSYTVRVTATDEDTSASANLALSIADVAPTLSLTAGSTRNEGAPVTFSWSATDPGADTVSQWRVEWGDGSTTTYAGNITSASRTYADNGSYTVRLTATNEDGAFVTTLPLTIANVAPTLTFTAGATRNEGTPITFNWTATDVSSDTVSQWRITWGDGSTSTFAGSVLSGSKTYADNGTYSVVLTAIDEDGSYQTTLPITVANVSPTLSLSAGATRNEGAPVAFAWGSTDPGADTVSQWRVEWGDGSTSTYAGGTTFDSKTYADNGSYTVRLTAIDEDGSYQTTLSLAIANVAPTLTVSGSSNPTEGSPFTLTFGKSDPGADTVSAWKVEWGDGTTSTYAGTVSSASKTYADNGSYSVRVTATDEDGSYQTTLPVSVANVAPTLTVTPGATRLEGSPLTLNFSRTDPGTDTVSAWKVEWGDGTTSTFAGTASSATKTYADNGSYTIRVTATDEDGAYQTTLPVVIADVAPTLAVVSPATVVAGATYQVQFAATDPGTDTVSQWQVAWGDGTTSTFAGSVTSASKVYGTAGNYAVEIRATNEDGTFTASRSVEVTAAAVAVSLSASAGPREGSSMTLNFSASSAVPVTVSSWTIDWGDGTSSTFAGGIASTTRTYADSGSYTVRATALIGGQSYSSEIPVTVADVAPVLSVSVPTGLREAVSFALNFSATDVGVDTISQWVVEWGDGTTGTYSGTATSAIKTYADNGTYTIRVTATDEDGSYVATTTAAVANVAPTLAVTASATPREGSPMTLTFAATDPGADTVSSWKVEWGDGTTSTYAGSVTSASKTYADNGLFTVRVTATDEDGSVQTTLPVSVANVAPTVTLSVPQALREGVQFTLGFSAADPGTDTRVLWRVEWGDGTTSTYAGTATSAAKTYADDGNYTLRVTAIDEDGSWSVLRGLSVGVVGPSISFSAPDTSTAGEAFVVNFSASGIGADPILSWSVDWGDGTVSQLPGNATSATRVWDSAGTRSIRVTAFDSDGAWQSATETVVVAGATLPTVQAGVPGEAVVGWRLPLNLSRLSGPALSTDQWAISWDNGATWQPVSANGETTAPAAGDHTLLARLTLADGRSSVGSANVRTFSAAELVSVAVNPEVVTGGRATVSFGGTGLAGINRLGWRVTWSDGQVQELPGTATSASRLVSEAGDLGVVVSSLHTAGAIASVEATVSAFDADPSLRTNGEIVAGLASSFRLSVDPIVNSLLRGWRIAWGDGSSDTLAATVTEVLHTYSGSSAYSARVVAIFDGNTEVAATVDFVVEPSPTAVSGAWKQVTRRTAVVSVQLESVPADAVVSIVAPDGTPWPTLFRSEVGGVSEFEVTTPRSAIDASDAGQWNVRATWNGQDIPLGTFEVNPVHGSSDLITTEAALALPKLPLLPGSEIRATAKILSGGSMITGATRVSFYLSTDDIWDDADTLLSSANVRGKFNTDITRSVSSRMKLPAGVAPGEYRVLAVADSGEVVAEANENDNVRVAGTINVVPPIVDLSGSRIIGVVSRRGGGVSTVRLMLKNLGNVAAKDLTVRVVLRDADGNLSETAVAEASLGRATLSPSAQRALSLRPRPGSVPPGATLVAIISGTGANPFATLPVTLAA